MMSLVSLQANPIGDALEEQQALGGKHSCERTVLIVCEHKSAQSQTKSLVNSACSRPMLRTDIDIDIDMDDVNGAVERATILSTY